MWGCLSAMLRTLLCPVFASYPAKRAFFVSNNLVSVDSHFGLYKYKQLFKPFLAKEKLVLMKNEAILTCFAPIPGRSLFLLYN